MTDVWEPSSGLGKNSFKVNAPRSNPERQLVSKRVHTARMKADGNYWRLFNIKASLELSRLASLVKPST
jgi:hypothetical protein